MVWPWTLTFWPKNVIRSSVSQDAPVTKVWQKSIDRYWRYRGNIKFSGAFGHAVTLTFDLLTPKFNQLISVPRCTGDKSLAKIRQQIQEISRKHKTTTWITDGRTAARTDDRKKHIAFAGAYRRRRLKNLQRKTVIKEYLGKRDQNKKRIRDVVSMFLVQLKARWGVSEKFLNGTSAQLRLYRAIRLKKWKIENRNNSWECSQSLDMSLK